MTLSNRLWRAIAKRCEDNPTENNVWAKVTCRAKGKRHYHQSIDLDEHETRFVTWLLANPRDDYFRFLIEHEREHNPEFLQ